MAPSRDRPRQPPESSEREASATAGDPEPVAPLLSDRARAALSHIAANEVLRLVVEALDGEGVRALPVKGIWTASLLYADPSERPIADLDLRVCPADLPRVEEIGERRGWRLLERAPAYGVLLFEIGGLGVDVESTIGPPAMCGLSTRELLARSEPRLHSCGLRILCPDLHDHAVVLTVNVFKDKLVHAFPWAIDDLRRIVRAEGFDPTTFVGRVAEARIVTIARTVALWMRDEHADSTWGAIERELPPQRGKSYARWFHWFARSRAHGQSLRLLARLGPDRWLDRARAVHRAFWWEATTGQERRQKSHG